MSRRTFTQADITRAVKGVLAAGLPVMCVRVEEGKFEVIVGHPERTEFVGANPLDRLHRVVRRRDTGQGCGLGITRRGASLRAGTCDGAGACGFGGGGAGGDSWTVAGGVRS